MRQTRAAPSTESHSPSRTSPRRRTTAPAEDTPPGGYVTQEALQDFEAGIKDIFRSFLEFFTTYMVESNGKPNNHDVEALGAKLQGK